MATLYVWLKFVHVLSVGVFLFGHGIAGFLGFVLRSPVSASTRPLLKASQVAGWSSYPLLLVILVTGVWMTFAGSFGRMAWPWAALVILIVTIGFMGFVARPYYAAREVEKESDEAVAARLSKARPELAVAVGGVAIVLILALMVFKPF